MKKLLLLMLLIPLFYSTAEETVWWMYAEFEPYLIVKGELKEQGYMDNFRKFFISNLKGYRHKAEISTIQRVLMLARTEPGFAAASLLQNEERQEYLYFSRPYTILLPNRLLVRSRDAGSFEKYADGKGCIDLEKVLAAGAAVIGTQSAREYGGNINSILEEYRSSGRIEELGSMDAQSMNLKKLAAGRIDGCIEYIITADYKNKTEKIGLDYKALKICGLPDYYYLSLSFSKSELGSRLLEESNRILDRNRYTREYMELVTSWYSDKKEIAALYRKAMKDAGY